MASRYSKSIHRRHRDVGGGHVTVAGDDCFPLVSFDGETRGTYEPWRKCGEGDTRQSFCVIAEHSHITTTPPLWNENKQIVNSTGNHILNLKGRRDGHFIRFCVYFFEDLIFLFSFFWNRKKKRRQTIPLYISNGDCARSYFLVSRGTQKKKNIMKSVFLQNDRI